MGPVWFNCQCWATSGDSESWNCQWPVYWRQKENCPNLNLQREEFRACQVHSMPALISCHSRPWWATVAFIHVFTVGPFTTEMFRILILSSLTMGCLNVWVSLNVFLDLVFFVFFVFFLYESEALPINFTLYAWLHWWGFDSKLVSNCLFLLLLIFTMFFFFLELILCVLLLADTLQIVWLQKWLLYSTACWWPQSLMQHRYGQQLQKR